MAPMSAVDKKIVRKWVAQQAGPGRRAALPSIVFGLLITTLGITQAWLVAVLLAAAITHTSQSIQRIFIELGVAIVLRAICQYLQDVSATRAGIAARRRLRREVLESIVAEGPGLLRRRHSSAIASLIVDRIEVLDGYFARWMPASVQWIASPCIVLLGLAFLAPHVIWIFAICGLAVPVAQAIFGIGAGLAARNQFLAMTRLQTRFLDRVRGIATIVIAGAVDREASALQEKADDLRQRTMRILRIAFLSSAAIDIAMVAAIIALVISEGVTLRHGSMTMPELARALVALLLVPEFFAPLRALALAYQDRAHASGAAEAMNDLIQPDAMASATIPFESRSITIRVSNVSFSWNATRGPVLQQVNFDVRPGEILVLEGRSGAGKSTLIELLLGFIQPGDGNIFFDGHDIAKLAPRTIAGSLAWIGQKPVIFAGTLRENILFGKPTASEQDMQAALKAAAIDSYLPDLPSGLDTVIGEGGFGLSGGQAQRIAIARAYLKDAPILLLDEPTAHLDPVTEQGIVNALAQLAKGRTVVLCSHSRALRALGTRVLQLERGCLLEHAA